ncbi:hypothetical protein RFI_15138 [Reticulomyxa filosa]|uniref:Uncharacterized protein n=1 Tax=Reticulomyxa filosa TaxID=46433 RepID=X6N713_RETFI|nr:hypothetical protein RFI_15138 [Reticulomyxa filosa]|eukprot:ETO22065.1 hypothetical protein RFI_15138 [Reticulomyxa filosa]
MHFQKKKMINILKGVKVLILNMDEHSLKVSFTEECKKKLKEGINNPTVLQQLQSWLKTTSRNYQDKVEALGSEVEKQFEHLKAVIVDKKVQLLQELARLSDRHNHEMERASKVLKQHKINLGLKATDEERLKSGMESLQLLDCSVNKELLHLLSQQISLTYLSDDLP